MLHSIILIILLFLLWKKVYNIKFAILAFLNVQFRGFKCLRLLCSHHPPPELLSPSQTEALYLLALELPGPLNPQPLATAIPPFVSMHSTARGTSYWWNHMVFVFL